MLLFAIWITFLNIRELEPAQVHTAFMTYLTADWFSGGGDHAGV